MQLQNKARLFPRYGASKSLVVSQALSAGDGSTREFRPAALADLSDLDITVDAQTDSRAWNATLEFADRLNVTVYDAVYVELAQRRALPLAILDEDMRRAGRQLGLKLLGVDLLIAM